MTRILPLLFLLTIMAFGCTSSNHGGEGDIIEGTGTVQYVELEGGFYGIVGDDGTRLDPANLDDAFKEDGLRVHFRAREKEDAVGFHMWGTIVELVSIERI